MYQGWTYHLFSKEFPSWKLKLLSLPCKASSSSSSPSFPPFPPPPLCQTAIKMRRFKDSRLPPSECEFYKELFYSLDFLVCDFTGLPSRLLLPGEIKSSDFWLAKSLSPSAVLPLGWKCLRLVYSDFAHCAVCYCSMGKCQLAVRHEWSRQLAGFCSVVGLIDYRVSMSLR